MIPADSPYPDRRPARQRFVELFTPRYIRRFREECRREWEKALLREHPDALTDKHGRPL